MAGLFDKQAEIYSKSRPTYPKEWFSMLSSLTAGGSTAWDVGTGNGQAAISVADYYDQVIATDISQSQIKHAIQHPKVHYLHTPASATSDEIISSITAISPEPIDLITVASAVHWFDLPTFYSVVNRVIRKPGGMIAVWGYSQFSVTPDFDTLIKLIHIKTLKYWDKRFECLYDGYINLPFPFEPVGLGREGSPIWLDMNKEMSFKEFLEYMRSWSGIVTATERGVEVLGKEVVEDLERAWGGEDVIRIVTYHICMLVGTPRMDQADDA